MHNHLGRATKNVFVNLPIKFLYWDSPKSLSALKAVLKAISSGFFRIKAAMSSTNAGKQQGSFR
jgi:hypothetical protein